MAYLSQIEAALFLGLTVETVEYLSKTCPKKGQQRTQPVSSLNHELHLCDS